jgi:hypothetical protein
MHPSGIHTAQKKSSEILHIDLRNLQIIIPSRRQTWQDCTIFNLAYLREDSKSNIALLHWFPYLHCS